MYAIETLKDLPVIDCESFYMRPVMLKDARDMFEYGSDMEVVKFVPWGPYRSVEDVTKAIQSVFLTRPENGVPYAYAIVNKKNKKMIGTCDFHSINYESKRGEIGYCMNKHYWNKGIMSQAVRELVRFGFEYLNLERVEVLHDIDNVASEKVILKNKFVYEGTLRKYFNCRGKQADCKIYSLIRSDYFK